ncbi:MAG: hypothetical protein ACR2OA_09525 [Rubripirellula sp.]
MSLQPNELIAKCFVYGVDDEFESVDTFDLLVFNYLTVCRAGFNFGWKKFDG